MGRVGAVGLGGYGAWTGIVGAMAGVKRRAIAMAVLLWRSLTTSPGSTRR